MESKSSRNKSKTVFSFGSSRNEKTEVSTFDILSRARGLSIKEYPGKDEQSLQHGFSMLQEKLDQELGKAIWERMAPYFRSRNSKTVKDFCRNSGVPYKKLISLKTGERIPRLSFLLALGMILEIPLDYLLLGQGNGPASQTEDSCLEMMHQNPAFNSVITHLLSFGDEGINAMVTLIRIIQKGYYFPGIPKVKNTGRSFGPLDKDLKSN